MACACGNDAKNCSTRYYTHQKSLATLDGKIGDPETTINLEMRDVLKVHDKQA